MKPDDPLIDRMTATDLQRLMEEHGGRSVKLSEIRKDMEHYRETLRFDLGDDAKRNQRSRDALQQIKVQVELWKTADNMAGRIFEICQNGLYGA